MSREGVTTRGWQRRHFTSAVETHLTRSGLEVVPGPQRLLSTHLGLSGKGPVRAGQPRAHQEDGQGKAGACSGWRERSSGIWKEGQGAIPRPPRLDRLKNGGQSLVRPPCPRPASGGVLGGRIVLAGCSLGTLSRCCSLGLSSCFCEMEPGPAAPGPSGRLPVPTGCLRDGPPWCCLVDLCPPCTQDPNESLTHSCTKKSEQ